MFAQTLMLNWKVARWPLLPFVLIAFGLPLLALRMAASFTDAVVFAPGRALLGALEIWTPFFPFLAFLCGAACALSVWAWDHRANHVYALTLPLPRWKYVLLKLGAGALLVFIPAFAVLAGALIGSSGLTLPDGLHAYPVTFAFRFLLAAMIAYAAIFALAAGTQRTTTLVLAGLVLFMIFGEIGAGYLNDTLHTLLPAPFELLEAALLRWPGPFNVYGGNWMLIDV